MDLNIEEAERQARALLDARINSVRALVTARQNLTDLRDQVAAAEREDARLYQAALRDGWTAEELKKLGLAEPEKATRVRKRAASRRAPAAGAGQPSGPESDVA